MELLFDVAHSPSLTAEQRALLLSRLKGYIDKEGVLHLVSQKTPSQWRNRQELIARLHELLNQSLQPRRKRIPTHPSDAARERRLHSKRLRSLRKQQRKRVPPEDW